MLSTCTPYTAGARDISFGPDENNELLLATSTLLADDSRFVPWRDAPTWGKTFRASDGLHFQWTLVVRLTPPSGLTLG